MNIGFQRQYYQQALNEYNTLVNEDKEIASRQSFENTNEKLQEQRITQQDAFDNARNEKSSLEAQVVTLEDLKFSTDDEAILASLDEKIAEINQAIEANMSVIDTAQVAFNEIATQIQEIEVKRAVEEAEALKTKAFLDAQSNYQYL